MSNAKMKRDVAKHIAWRNREMPSDVVQVTRQHEKTFVAVGARVLLKKDGKPRKRKGTIVSFRKYDTVNYARSVEVYSSIGERPDHLWTGPRLGRA